MASFNELFGDDRDIVQETGGTAGQKLRVDSSGGLESFDLAVETIAGGATGGTSFNLVSTLQTPSGFTQIEVDDLFDGLTMIGKTARFNFNNDPQETFSMGQSVSLNVTTELNQSGAVIPIGSYVGTITETSGTSFSNPDMITVGFEGVTGWSNGTIQNLTTISSGTVAFNVTVSSGGTTVTGDLKVTGLEAGNVVSDADGNLSVSAASSSGVSGTPHRVPEFNSAGDGLQDSALIAPPNFANVITTSVRLNNALTGDIYTFFANAPNQNGGVSVMFPISSTGSADTVAEVFLQFGGLGDTTVFGPFSVKVLKSDTNDPDGNFDRGPFGGDETFFLTNGGSFTGDFARAIIPDGHTDVSTISSLLTTGADTSTLSLGDNGNINLGFQNSKIVNVRTHETYELRAPLNISGDVLVTGDLRVNGNWDIDIADINDVTTLGNLVVTSSSASDARIALGLTNGLADINVSEVTGNLIGNVGSNSSPSIPILNIGTSADGSDATYNGKLVNVNTAADADPSTPAPADFRIWAGTVDQFANVTEVTDGSVLYIIRDN